MGLQRSRFLPGGSVRWTNRMWVLFLIVSNLVSWTLFAVYSGPGLLRSYMINRITSPFIAAYFGQVNTLEAWLQNGGDPNATETTGESLLQYATLEGAHEASDCEAGFRTVLLLLDRGADPNYTQNESIDLPLMNVAKFGEFGTFVLLLEAGADPANRNERGETVRDLLEGVEVPYRAQKIAYLKTVLARSEQAGEDAPFPKTPSAAVREDTPSE